MLTVHMKAFRTQNICLDFLHIFVHKPGSSSTIRSGAHLELSLPQVLHFIIISFNSDSNPFQTGVKGAGNNLYKNDTAVEDTT